MDFPSGDQRVIREFAGCHQPKRMDPGIRPAAALDPDFSAAEEFAEPFLHYFLHGDPVRLPLPAVVGGPVVCQLHFHSPFHSVFCRAGGIYECITHFLNISTFCFFISFRIL